VAHGLEVWRPFTLLERRSLKGATCVLCVSDYTRRQLLSHCAIRPERIAILPNALDPYLGTPPTEPQPAGAPVILTMTRLSLSDQYKGVDHLIEAMPAVRREIPDARLRVVGRGDALPSLQAAARRLGLEGVVEFVGYRSDADLHGDFASCRLFALPSQKEGFGLVYLEAMAHGRPCLGARSGGVPEVISEESGVLVDYGDVPGIAAAMVAALRRNWPVKPITERVETFSYDNFKRRLGSLMSEHEKTAESR
jgi:glycosyltransferase involved in cell wall biosynthesis